MTNNQNLFISIIIPAYNEAKRISNVLNAIEEYFSQRTLPYEVIVVDDGSTDITKEVVQDYQDRLQNLKIIAHSPNKGKGYAVKQGMLAGQGQYFLLTDADNATPFEEIDKLLNWIKQDYPVVIGSRYLSDSNIVIRQSFYRRSLGRLANLIIQLLAVWGIKDTQCGFKCFENNAAREIFKRQTIDGWGFDFEILAIARKLGYQIKEVPVSWQNVGDSRVRPIKSALKTLRELLVIKVNLVRGKYE